MQKIFKLIRRPRVFITAGILLVVAGVIGYSLLSGEEQVFQTVEAKRGTVREEVAVVGRIQATQRLDLGLLGSGKIAYVFGAEGDHVERGELLVSLVSDDLQAQLASAQANLEREQIRLDQMVNGEEDAVSQANFDSASSAEASAARSLESQLRESYAATDSALGAYVDQFFENPRSGQASFETYVTVSGTRYFISAPQGDRSQIQRSHNEAIELLEAWREALAGTDLEAKAQAGRAAVSHTQLYLGDLAAAINRYRPTASSDQAVYDGFRADIAAARSAVNGAASGLSAADASYRSALSGKNVAATTLQLEQSASEIAMQEASVRSAAAQVALAQAQVDKNSIFGRERHGRRAAGD
jgi:multidrug efflux pump subunit AcrA (membrane-fusion protein)